ncbi:hypothetical protein HF086_003580 [Spodoptera exigua]|uniref:Uncharacterized protein n=1 Tax=Spodoptera exigua TaxID=7107 RepID=A0A922SJ60_SPOEX|nr:hypothetical protein HF086_003580 [Spodoptera exigua]
MGTKRVLITGFGPFPGAEVNVSWEGVNTLDKEEIEKKHDIHLFREKIEVRYSYVDGCLTIHVGVKPDTQSLTLETQASREGYVNFDTTNSRPEEEKHSFDGPDVICTELCVNKLVEQFNNNTPIEGHTAEVSSDAGK